MSNNDLHRRHAEIDRLTEENAALRDVVRSLAWMARRYADGRSTYAPTLYNDCARSLLALGVELNPTADGTIWARDGMGANFDGLTPEQREGAERAETAIHYRVLLLQEEIQCLRRKIAEIEQSIQGAGSSGKQGGER